MPQIIHHKSHKKDPGVKPTGSKDEDLLLIVEILTTNHWSRHCHCRKKCERFVVERLRHTQHTRRCATISHHNRFTFLFNYNCNCCCFSFVHHILFLLYFVIYTDIDCSVCFYLIAETPVSLYVFHNHKSVYDNGMILCGLCEGNVVQCDNKNTPMRDKTKSHFSIFLYYFVFKDITTGT
jgi:hypothetical protein